MLYYSVPTVSISYPSLIFVGKGKSLSLWNPAEVTDSTKRTSSTRFINITTVQSFTIETQGQIIVFPQMFGRDGNSISLIIHSLFSSIKMLLFTF